MMDAVITSDVLRWATLLVIFLAVVAGVLVIARALASQSAVRRRLAADQAEPGWLRDPEDKYLREQARNEGWHKLTAALERAGVPLTDEKDNGVRAKLAMAGYPSPLAARVFTLARLGLLFGLPGLYLVMVYFQAERPAGFTIYLVSVTLALIGMYAPNYWLRARAARRQNEILNGFPDCLDLTLVCVEAGLGLEAAFDRVGRELMRSHPRLAEILSASTLEMRAGASREQALRSMASRAQVDEIKAFTTLLIQSDRLGTSIAQTLRVYAAEMREKRRMRAEEKAHKLPVLLSIPLVACMLPTMIGVLMLPAGIRVVRVIMPMMQGGATP